MSLLHLFYSKSYFSSNLSFTLLISSSILYSLFHLRFHISLIHLFALLFQLLLFLFHLFSLVFYSLPFYSPFKHFPSISFNKFVFFIDFILTLSFLHSSNFQVSRLFCHFLFLFHFLLSHTIPHLYYCPSYFTLPFSSPLSFRFHVIHSLIFSLRF